MTLEQTSGKKKPSYDPLHAKSPLYDMNNNPYIDPIIRSMEIIDLPTSIYRSSHSHFSFEP